MARAPLFLERRSYRMRRMMDAVRVLPVLGLGLWMVPLLWHVPIPSDDATPHAMPMSAALRYVFGVWMVLILTAFALWWRTRNPDVSNATPDDGTP